MNELAFAFGGFLGNLIWPAFAVALIWKFCAWVVRALTKSPALAAYVGGCFALWYTMEQDLWPNRIGAIFGILVMALIHWASEVKQPADPTAPPTITVAGIAKDVLPQQERRPS
jgi:hypothetical protein